MLHVTNGDVAAEAIRALGLPGEVLPWRDVLHEGPVPAPATLDSLRPLRARFLAGYGPSAVEIAGELEVRDRRLAAAAGGDLILWFEHDLYDQLQLAQILDWCAASPTPKLALAQSSDYLGCMDAAQLRSLWDNRRAVTDAQLAAARRAWAAFSAPDPRAIEGVLDTLADLPFLGPSLVRHLEEFPSVENGLSRTERQILEALSVGSWTLSDLFRAAHHDREDPFFLGDLGFRDAVTALATGDATLAAIAEERVWLTAAGRGVLAGNGDRVEMLGVDRWLGGVHLRGRRVPFRWDSRARRIVAS